MVHVLTRAAKQKQQSKSVVCSSSKSASKSSSMCTINKSKSYANNAYKTVINTLFADSLRRNFSNKDPNSFIAYLDGDEGFTSSKLLEKGFGKNELLVIEADAKVAAVHRAREIPCHEGTVWDYCSTELHPEYLIFPNNYYSCLCRGVFLDFCGQVASHGKEALDFVRVINLTEGTVLGFTFTRMRVKESLHHKRMREFQQNLQRVVEKKGFFLKPGRQELLYGGDGLGGRGAPMHWVQYEVTAEPPKRF